MNQAYTYLKSCTDNIYRTDFELITFISLTVNQAYTYLKSCTDNIYRTDFELITFISLTVKRAYTYHKNAVQTNYIVLTLNLLHLFH